MDGMTTTQSCFQGSMWGNDRNGAFLAVLSGDLAAILKITEKKKIEKVQEQEQF